MNIAILVPNFSEYSGDARVVEVQADEFIEQGNKVTIFTLASNIKYKNAKIVELGMPRNLFWERVYRLFFPLDFIKTMRYLPKLKHYDVIISHNYPMNWLSFLAKKCFKIRYIYWNHGLGGPDNFPNAKIYEKLYGKLFILLTKITVRNADRIISVSKYGQKEFKHYTGFESEVIYNKLDTKRFYRNIDGNMIREKFKLDNDPVILFVGRIAPHKGVHLLIDAFKLIKQEIPNLKLIIAGKHTYGGYSKKLKNVSDDSIIFVGHISYDDIPFYYAACNVFTTCSLCETFDLPIVEAQMCGKPAVAFNIGAHSEVINENGILVEKGNIKKFAEACTILLKHMH